MTVLDETLKEHQRQRTEILSPGLSIALKNIEIKLNMTADRLCNYIEMVLDKYCDEDQEDYEQDI